MLPRPNLPKRSAPQTSNVNTADELASLLSADSSSREYSATADNAQSLPSCRHTLYPLAKISELLSQSNKKKVRFVVTTNGMLWLAREGNRCSTIPGHGDMAQTCVAAGTLKFSADKSALIAINHKSGAFRPRFDSLCHVLAILLKTEGVTFADSIELQKLNQTSGGTEHTYHVSKNILDTWKDREDVPELSPQPQDNIKKVFIADAQKRRRALECPARKLFEGDGAGSSAAAAAAQPAAQRSFFALDTAITPPASPASAATAASAATLPASYRALFQSDAPVTPPASPSSAAAASAASAATPPADHNAFFASDAPITPPASPSSAAAAASLPVTPPTPRRHQLAAAAPSQQERRVKRTLFGGNTDHATRQPVPPPTPKRSVRRRLG